MEKLPPISHGPSRKKLWVADRVGGSFPKTFVENTWRMKFRYQVGFAG